MALDPNRAVLADGNVRVSLPWFLARIGGDWTGRSGDAAVPEAAFVAYVMRQGAPPPSPAEPFRQWFRDRGYLLDTSTPLDVGLNPDDPPERGTVLITPAFERLLAGGGSSSSSTTPILLLGGAAILGFWFFTGGAGASPGRGLRGVASERPYRVRDKLTRARYYFDSRDEAERFVRDVSTSEITGEPLHRWAHRLVVEKNT